ncbi:hypothetical protein CK224_04735 [Mesorhizobium sp. WSM3862]|nr:hypothetical protein CK224_04735 [Mesorhizobium sp. WSM3862]
MRRRRGFRLVDGGLCRLARSGAGISGEAALLAAAGVMAARRFTIHRQHIDGNTAGNGTFRT